MATTVVANSSAGSSGLGKLDPSAPLGFDPYGLLRDLVPQPTSNATTAVGLAAGGTRRIVWTATVSDPFQYDPTTGAIIGGRVAQVQVFTTANPPVLLLTTDYSAAPLDAAAIYNGVVQLQSSSGTQTSLLDAIFVTQSYSFTGNAGGDVFSGALLADSLSGAGGNDTLIGNAGDDTIEGGAGNDILIGGDGGETTGDTVSYASSTAAVAVNLGLATAQATGAATGSDILLGFENVVGGSGNDTLTGTAGGNLITGGLGNDLMAGGAGADTLTGGGGSDTASYAGDTAGVSLALDAGGNAIGSGGDAEGDSLAGIANLIGGAGSDTLSGNAGANRIDGGAGDDVITGGGGGDMLIGGTNGSGGDWVSYAASAAGVSVNIALATVQATGDTLSGFENLIGGAGHDTLSGSAGGNIVSGGGGSDSIAAGGGDDTLLGGDGADTLDGGANTAGVGDIADYGDSLVEGVQVSLVTGATETGGTAAGDTLIGIEHLAGSEFADTLTGDGGANRLVGRGGDDTLDGGAGNDTLIGGAGADLIDGGSAGSDTASYAGSAAGVSLTLADDGSATGSGGDAAGDTLAHIGNLVGGSASDTLTGNASGNVIDGGAGDDVIEGGGGNDTLIGGAADTGDFVSYLGAAGGVSINLALATAQSNAANTAAGVGADVLSGFENLSGSGFADTLVGSAANNAIQGGAGADSLSGGSGDDTLDGGDGADTLDGGLNTAGIGDTAGYGASLAAVQVNLGDALAEAGGLAAGDRLIGIENVDGSVFDDTITGDGGANKLWGRGGADTLSGGLGNDTLVGGTGADVLLGGGGGDTASYEDDTAGVTVALADDGSATTSGGNAAGDTLAGISNLVGGAGNDELDGNVGANVLDGGAGSDTLDGGDGKDVVRGGSGNDLITGGAGADTLDGGDGIDMLSYAGSTAGVTVSLNVSPSIGAGGAAAGDRIANFENVTGSLFGDTLQGGAAGNVLSGLDGNDKLDGGGGADTLAGGAGNDTYIVDNAGDVVLEATDEGTDTVQTSVSYTLTPGSEIERLVLGGVGAIDGTGNALDNTLTGNSGNNVLAGAGGADVLDGGGGIDTASYAGSASAVSVSLVTNSGTGGDAEGDLLISIENITGSSGNDTLVGNAAVNRLDGGAGDDILVGGAGGDVLVGGAGRDVASYAAAIAAVTVQLGLAVQAGIGDAAGDKLIGIEDIEGSVYADKLTGDIGDNKLTGNAGNDTLTGNAGADTLIGGIGNDLYVIDGSDTVVEADGEGTDTVRASFTTTLGAFLENLELAATAGAIAGTGNAQANQLTGNAADNSLDGSDGDDTLIGGGGNDTLTGGTGNDDFVFAAASGNDVITDFTAGLGQGDRLNLLALTGFDTFAKVMAAATQVGTDTVITLSAGNTITLTGVNKAALAEDDVLIGTPAPQAPTDIQLSNASVLDNATSGTVVGTLSATDPDAGSIFTFKLLDNANGRFAVSGNQLKLVGTLDYNTAQIHTVTVRVTDNAGLTYDEDIQIFVVPTSNKLIGDAANNKLVSARGGLNEQFFGFDGNDFMIGLGGADTYDGGLGSDVVSYFEGATAGITVNLANPAANTGSASDDVFIGIEGIRGTMFGDVLIGDGNNNVLIGGGGADTLDGGGGQDQADYRFAAATNATLGLGIVVDLADRSQNTGEAAGDLLVSIERLRGSAFRDMLIGDNLTYVGSVTGNVLEGGSGADTIDGGGGGTDFARYGSSSAGVTVSLANASLGTGDAKGDVLVNIEGLWGSDFADKLIGDDNDNILVGWIGADTLVGGAGIDTAAYYSNVIRGTTGVVASLSNPAINTGDAAGDTYVGIENLWGSPFADRLFGDDTNNVLSGDGGNDLLIGEGGADTLDGGGGTSDMASYQTSTAAITASLANEAGNTGDAAGDHYVAIEGLRGSSFDDQLTGDGSGNFLAGGEGADTLDGGAGNDFADYRFATAGLTVNLGTPSENTGEAAGDVYISIERLRGSAFADHLIGNASGNNLDGGAGADTLDGGSALGTDFDLAQYSSSPQGVTASLLDPTQNTGDAKGDVYVNIEGLWGSDFADKLTGDGNSGNLLNGGAGADTLDGGAGGNDRAAYLSGSAAVRIDLANPNNNTGDGVGDVYIGIEGLVGGDLADTLMGDAGGNQLEGRLGNDILMGRGGADTLIGDRAGDPAGIDFASYAETTSGVRADLGTPGTNTGAEAVGDSYVAIEGLIGGSGDDTLVGNGLDNIFVGGVGADNLIGVGGNDTADYRFATTGLTVSLANAAQNTGEAAGDAYVSIENLTGSAFDDVLIGDAGANRLDGGSGGTDTVSYAGSASAVSASLALGGSTSGDTFVSIENLVGGDLADSLEGGSGANVLDGGLGDDSLSGLGGDDILIGGAGSDTLDGGSNGTLGDTASYATASGSVVASLVTGGSAGDAAGDVYTGIENLTGGGGGDTLTGDGGANILDGGGGGDSIDGGTGDDVLIGGAGADTLVGGGGSDTVSFQTASAGVVADMLGGGLAGDAAGDTYSGIANFTGSQFDDTLYGSDGDNRLQGLGGNDVLVSYGGNDTLDGGDGLDIASYNGEPAPLLASLADPGANTGAAAGSVYISIEGLAGGDLGDTLIGNAQDNVLEGGLGADSLVGGAGFDTASYANAAGAVQVWLATPAQNAGEAAGDSYSSVENVVGSAFADVIVGDKGSNRLFGGAGNDTLGSGGADTANGGVDVLDGGDGFDVVSFRTAPAGAQVVLNDQSRNAGAAAGLVLHSIEGFMGSSFADFFVGDGSDNVVYGSAGADFFDGGDGFDTISYKLSTAAVSADLFAQHAGVGDGAGDSFFSVERIVGSSFNDTLWGGAFDTYVEGGAGNDIIHTGGSYADGGAGADQLIGDFAFNAVSYASSTSGLTIDFSNTANNTGDAAGDTYTSIETLIGSNFDDVITGNSGSNVTQGTLILLDGAGGNDAITSKAFGAVLVGGAGADTLVGYTTDPTDASGQIFGQLNVASYETAAAGVVANIANSAANTGDAAGDTYQYINGLRGSAFDDELTVSDSEPGQLDGGAGNDTLHGGASWFDALEGGAGADVLDGGAGGGDTANYNSSRTGLVVSLINPLLNTGDAAGDTYIGIEGLLGSWYNDTLTGDDNANIISGGAGATLGNDVLNGLGGDDQLIGGWGADTMSGGSGVDRFIYQSDQDGGDTIVDFASGTDKLQVSTFGFAELGYTGLGPLPEGAWALDADRLIIGNGAVAPDAAHGYLLFDTTDANHHILYWDKDGTGSAAKVMLADLQTSSLSAGDFLVL